MKYIVKFITRTPFSEGIIKIEARDAREAVFRAKTILETTDAEFLSIIPEEEEN